MKQVSAKVVYEPEQILGELERADARTFKRPEARNVSGSWIIWLRCPDIAREAKPGQFVMVHCGEECLLPRPFSIHQVNGDDIALFFAVWEDGKGTNWLSLRRKGDRIELFPQPLGNGFSVDPAAQNLLLVAGGVGIAPLHFLASQALDSGHKVKMLRGASGEFKPSGERNPNQHYPEDRLPSGMEVETITSSLDGQTDMVVDLLRPVTVDWADRIFACGPLPMYKAMAELPELKNKTVQVSLEVVMGCGLGICYGCTVKTRQGLKQVCRDGPVFNLDDIIWGELNW